MGSADDYFKHLKLLIEKYNEQSSLFYTRHDLLMHYMLVLIGALILLVTGSFELPDDSPWGKVIWILGIFIGLFAIYVFSKFYFIMKTSNEWIKFWEAKIIYLEEHNAPDGHEYYFFLDRVIKDPKMVRSKKRIGEIDENKIRDMYKIYEQRFRNPPAEAEGVGKALLKIARIICWFWIVVTLLFFARLCMELLNTKYTLLILVGLGFLICIMWRYKSRVARFIHAHPLLEYLYNLL